MPEDSYTQLNDFLVNLFNDILRIEEHCLSSNEFKNLSIKEIHIIEAVCNASQTGGDNRASAIAEALGVTAGTLTVAVNTLERKGYLERRRDSGVKRVVRLFPTQSALEVNRIHSHFHHEMAASIIEVLNPEELVALTRGLHSIQRYFKNKEKT